MRNFYSFIGKSGCGKGTQVELLKKYLEERNPTTPVLWYGSGKFFRELIAGEGYTQGLARKIDTEGGLQPAFLAVHIWSHFFIEDLKGNEDVILDGTPRKIDEARMLEGAFDFYGAKVTVILVNVSREWAAEKLLKRKRQDDTEAQIQKRLDWFDEEVAPTVAFYRNHPRHTFLDINGEQTIEEVHEEIIGKIQSAE